MTEDGGRSTGDGSVVSRPVVPFIIHHSSFCIPPSGPFIRVYLSTLRRYRYGGRAPSAVACLASHSAFLRVAFSLAPAPLTMTPPVCNPQPVVSSSSEQLDRSRGLLNCLAEPRDQSSASRGTPRSASDWGQVLALATLHDVAPLLYDRLIHASRITHHVPPYQPSTPERSQPAPSRGQWSVVPFTHHASRITSCPPINHQLPHYQPPQSPPTFSSACAKSIS